MGRHSLAGGVVLVLTVALALGGEPPPDRLKEAADVWWGTIEGFAKNRDAQLEKIFEEMRQREVDLNKLLEDARGAVLLGENQFKEAADRLEASLKDPQSNRKLHGMMLVELSSLYATMGDYDKAHTTVVKAWQKAKEYEAAAPDDPWPVIDAAAAAGSFLLFLEKPKEAADCIDHGLALCNKRWRGISLEGTPLRARCLLAKAELANFIGNYSTGRDHAAEGLKLLKRLYPHAAPNQYPRTLESASGLTMLAAAKVHLQEELEAFELLREAQQILEKLFPKGHPSLATTDSNLAQLYIHRGKLAEAKDLLQKAYDMYTVLFPSTKYKKSHPGLIQAMSSLGSILDNAGSKDPKLRESALRFRKKALDGCRKYYTSAHASKIEALLNYGWSLRSAGRIEEAENHFREALKMAYQLYPQSKHPHGHPLIAQCLLYVGTVQALQSRRLREARQTIRQAQEMYQSFGQPDNPYLSAVTQYLGMLAFLMRDPGGAREAFAQALTLDQGQLRRYARVASEAEAISCAQRRRVSLHGYLTVSREDNNDARSYHFVWTDKSAVTRVLRERQALLHATEATSSPVSQCAQEVRELSALISNLLRKNQQDEPLRKTLAELMEKEESLMRKLVKLLPELERSEEMNLGPGELAKRLPEAAVFVDFVRYKDFLSAKSGRDRYAAFVLKPRQLPKRVELGYAEPIHDAVIHWRKAVDRLDPLAPAEVQKRVSDAADKYAAELRRLVWEPIAKYFPTPRPKRIYLAPDGDLSCLPFAALPSETKGSILLEEYTIAYVPHGPFLLERLQHPISVAAKGGFLSLRDVAFDANRPITGSIEVEKTAQRFGLEPIALQGRRATPQNLSVLLTQARFAHLATHGFFDHKALQEEHHRLDEYLRDLQFENRTPLSGVGVGIGGRSPLSYTGLVLADGTVLTGSMISTLPLERLQLVILSACETGLGEYTAGEGVQALLRAFHLAGCPNVIATLWRIDDAATKALEEEFYRLLWEKRLDPLEAMRLAQLEIYRHPERVLSPEHNSARRTPVNLWAAFVHSGAGL